MFVLLQILPVKMKWKKKRLLIRIFMLCENKIIAKLISVAQVITKRAEGTNLIPRVLIQVIVFRIRGSAGFPSTESKAHLFSPHFLNYCISKW